MAEEKDKPSRREFLRRSAQTVAGGVVAATGLSALASPAKGQENSPTGDTNQPSRQPYSTAPATRSIPGWVVPTIIAGSAVSAVVASAAVGIYLENPKTYLTKWGITIVEANTPEQREQAYRLRHKDYHYFKPDHPHGRAMGLQIDGERMTDAIDDDPRATVFLITKQGKPIGTFRLTDASKEGGGWVMDAVFAPDDLESINREGAMEASWLAVDPKAMIASPLDILRAVFQAKSVLAIEITKAALAHAHKKGMRTLITPTLESQKDFFARVGISTETLPIHTVAMGRDHLTISLSDLQRVVEEAPPEIREAIDPKGQWRGGRTL